MPPIVPRKRRRSESTSELQPPARLKKADVTKGVRPNVFQTLDADPGGKRTAQENKAFLAQQESDSGSELSEVESDDFEDVLPPHRVGQGGPASEHNASDDGMEWEDAIQDNLADRHMDATPHRVRHVHQKSANYDAKDLEITLSKPGVVGSYTGEDSAAVGRKGPSKIERLARQQAHCMHVQFLMWHNAIRNSWINNKEVQRILVDGLPEQVKKEISRYKAALSASSDLSIGRGGGGIKRKEAGDKRRKATGKEKATEKTEKQRIRDWGADAQKQTSGSTYFKNGDPLLRLLKYLIAYWKKRFRVTAPMLRKIGYKGTKELEGDLKSFQNDAHNPLKHGERIISLSEFKDLAKKCQGSRDVGAQLFTALLRGLDIETRMVASLQPTGFGWAKAEEGMPTRNSEEQHLVKAVEPEVPVLSEDEPDVQDLYQQSNIHPITSAVPRTKRLTTTAASRTGRGTVSAPINLDDGSSELSEPPSSDEASIRSVVDITPIRVPRKLFDEDVTFPTYWTEVLCPATNTYFSVSALVNPLVAQKHEEVAKFEPRGAAADKAKVVICYVLAYSEDGTAKDVTVRYLKNHVWPGRTKCFRLPAEKVAIYNKRGKIIRHEEYDWFRRVMSGYSRPEAQRTLADELEDQSDLVIVMPTPKAKDGSGRNGEETLQGYKSSAEYVLERHLRREEAILPGAKIVKYFHVGKGNKTSKETVYRRADLVNCKSVETWHKEGRQVRPGEQPLKHVPFRAVTLVRKRELEDAAKDAGGEKPLQGLYAEDQTAWIIPDPIGPDGKIPKNAFGNIDVYVPTMVPEGATHIPLRGTRGVCKKLGIDFAEAVTGFEFGKQRAVPVITGVVVAEGNRGAVIDAWKEQQEIQRRKEDAKREAKVLTLWKKFLVGMRVIERMKKEYGTEGGDVPDEVNPFTNRTRDAEKMHGTDGTQGDSQAKKTIGLLADNADDHDLGGGFLPEGMDVEVITRLANSNAQLEDGGFLREDDHSDRDQQSAEMEIELHDSRPTTDKSARIDQSYSDHPISLQSLHKKIALNDEATELGDFQSGQTSEDKTPLVNRSRRRLTRVTSRGCRKRAVPLRSQEQRESGNSTPGYTSADDHISDESEADTVEQSSDESENYVAPKRSKSSKTKTDQTSGSQEKRTGVRASTRSATTKSPYFN